MTINKISFLHQKELDYHQGNQKSLNNHGKIQKPKEVQKQRTFGNLNSRTLILHIIAQLT